MDTHTNPPRPRMQDYIAVVVSSLALCGMVFLVTNLQPSNRPVTTTTQLQSGLAAERKQFGKPRSHNFKSTSTTELSTKPNIVFILADDMGYNGIGQDWDEDQTTFGKALTSLSPNLQTLAKDGVIISQYYAQEVCTPSRASFLTGRYPLSVGMQFGVVEPYTPWALDLNETTLAEVLQAEGYDTYLFGKWHLGHHTARYLPTARGFDQYVGYVNGDNFYFTKTCPNEQLYYDFTVSNTTCYQKSTDATAFTTYSTTYYKDLALEVIEAHADDGDDDTSSPNPFFLYLALQSVHAPFFDDSAGEYSKLTSILATNETWTMSLVDSIMGSKSQMYGLTLNIMDTAVQEIVASLGDNGLMDNTYVIFASDNGGCYLNGGKNAPFRGSKASLFEGGMKVDAFIYSPSLLADGTSGNVYSNIFHVSDWFPTILDMAGITYESPEAYELDGVSHLSAINGYTSDAPRDYLLYNAYTKVMYPDGKYDFDMWSNGVFAIRDSQYKLIHSYNGSDLAAYYSGDDEYSDDTDLSNLVDCKQQSIYEGHYVMYLFDLLNDPYETTNLIDSTDEDVITHKEALYAEIIAQIADKSTEDWTNSLSSQWDDYCETEAESVWSTNGMNIGPFLNVNWDHEYMGSEKTYPEYCG